MKTLTIVLTLFSLSLFAQKSEVFRIDSIPEQGVLLVKGWKWHAGDNPDFAKPDFDDSKWESIDPTKDIFDLPKVSKKGDIFWLRLPLVVSDSVSKEALIMTLRQSGAAEIFLNGKLIQSLGILSKDKHKIKAFFSSREPFNLPIQLGRPQILAVRYAFQPNIHYGTHFANTNTLLSIEIASLKTWRKKDIKAQLETRWNILVGTIFATLCILYFAFYLFFSKQKINLYFTIYTALQVFPYGIFSGFYTLKNIESYYWISNSVIITAVIAHSFLLLAVYRLFNQKIGIIFWLIVSLGIVCIPTAFFVYDWGWVVFGIGFNFSVSLELLRIAIVSVLKNKKGAWFIASGGFAFCAAWVLFLYSSNAANNVEFIAPYFYALAQIIIPLSVAINLGYNFAQTNISLQQKLTEVEILSIEKQQILANQNETLEKQVNERTSELKASQTQLIQKEKLASLGELTAGIAHEIQNPLNFVNNFSEVSAELVGEMNHELDKGDIVEAKVIAIDLKQNLEKITLHGKRASSIVKSMLEHSKASSGEKELTDINALTDEYLSLSYHGLRAKDKNFNADFQLLKDESIPKIAVISQDMGRVLLNLINNAFYAAYESKKPNPMVKVTTKLIPSSEGVRLGGAAGGWVSITVKDNGNGIPKVNLEKIFQPFFTTKPTGQGTGLGLSLAYDIITKGHGGTIEVESEEIVGTEFIVKLPL